MNGIHTLSWEDYGKSEGVSNSMLKSIIEDTPLHFYARHVAKTIVEEETDAQRIGSIFHRSILEPETMKDAFAVKPPGMRLNTKAGMQWEELNGGKPILTTDQYLAIKGMKEAVWNHRVASKFLEGSDTERSFFAEDGHGTLRKARVDIVPKGGNILPDIKTCISASPERMSKVMNDLGYYRQAAFTLELCRILGLPFQRWVLICVEKTAPFDVCCFPIDEQAVRVGRMEIEGAIQTYRNCLETGVWPGRNSGLADELTLPKWRDRELNAA